MFYGNFTANTNTQSATVTKVFWSRMRGRTIKETSQLLQQCVGKAHPSVPGIMLKETIINEDGVQGIYETDFGGIAEPYPEGLPHPQSIE